MNDWNLKNKKTGEYFTVISKCSEGNWRLIGKDGIVKCIKESIIKKVYETTEVDYTKYTEALCQLFKVNPQLRDVGDIIARRCTSDYYKPGVLVYFIRPTFCGEAKDTRYYGVYYGPEAIYEIIDIVKDFDQEGLWWVQISRWRGNNKKPESRDKREVDFKLPMYLDTLVSGDVYSEVRRYDMPF